MSTALWGQCLQLLEQELSDQQLNTWIRPLQVIEEGSLLRLLAPNQFVLDWVKQHFLEQITRITDQISSSPGDIRLSLEIGSQSRPSSTKESPTNPSNPVSLPRILSPLIRITADRRPKLNIT